MSGNRGQSGETSHSTPSGRVVDQRIRNRIIEELSVLANGDAAVHDCGAIEYFNNFFSWFPLQDTHPLVNSVMTSEELKAVEHIRTMMIEAAAATPKMVTDTQLIRSGWPVQIAPAAKAALALLMRRGLLSEECEEDVCEGA